MTKRILTVLMIGMAMLFTLQLGMEKLFSGRLSQMVPTLLETESTQGVRSFPVKEQKPGTGGSDGSPGEIIAVFGVDQEQGDTGRSDCILLAGIGADGGLRLCSIARDTLVTLPQERIETKLCHAYAYGGPELALRTINESFGLQVEKYVSVNFSQLEQLVDQVGGVPMELSQAEWRYLGLREPYLGRTRLSGERALAYCRIRAIDNDEARTGRQRKLLTALISELRQQPLTELPGAIQTGIRMCRTNLKLGDIYRLSRTVLSRDMEPEGITIPGENIAYWSGIRKDGGWYYVYNLNEAGAIINSFLRGAEKTENNSCIQISGVIE